MADDNDAPEDGGGSSSSPFGFLARKIGPLPVWVYAAAAVGAYYWYTHYGPGASKQQAAATGASTIVVAGGGGGSEDFDHGGSKGGGKPPPPKGKGGGGWKTITVPDKWNGWSLDQIAKYLHWTPETLQDVEEANAQGGKEITGKTKFHTGDTLLRPVGPDTADTSSSPAETATSTGTGPGATLDKNKNVPASGVYQRAAPAGVLPIYATAGQQAGPGNTMTGWEAAAINYLIGEGVPPDQASTSVWAYLHQEPLSSRMQANVNLASDGIGPPPGVPGPAITVKRVPPRNTPRKVTTGA